MKVLQSGFYWPSPFKEATQMCRVCDRFQRLGKLSRQHMKPLNPILVVELFDFGVPKAIISDGGFTLL